MRRMTKDERMLVYWLLEWGEYCRCEHQGQLKMRYWRKPNLAPLQSVKIWSRPNLTFSFGGFLQTSFQPFIQLSLPATSGVWHMNMRYWRKPNLVSLRSKIWPHPTLKFICQILWLWFRQRWRWDVGGNWTPEKMSRTWKEEFSLLQLLLSELPHMFGLENFRVIATLL